MDKNATREAYEDNAGGLFVVDRKNKIIAIELVDTAISCFEVH